MPSDFTVVAIIAAYNEADIIGAVIRDLIDQGISIYFIDDGSTDGTLLAVERFAGRGVIGMEPFRSGEPVGSPKFSWERILRRKAELASEIDADWFIHHDADEIRESPWADVPLKEAIRRVDSLGYNAIDFESLDFRPTDDRFRAGDDMRAAFPFYSKAAPHDRLQIRCWKKTPGPVDLASTGGHEARFENRRVFPVRFLLRHYPIRSLAHGKRKVFVERQPRFIDAERARGWHVQYDDLVAGGPLVRDPNTLTRFDPVDVRIGLSLRHRGVEALEESLDDVRAGLETAHAGVATRTKEIERLQEELHLKAGEALAFCESLAQREVDIAGVRAHANNLEQELTGIHAHANNLEQELAGLRAHAKNLELELAGTRAHAENLEQELSATRTHVKDLDRELTGSRAQVAQYASELGARQSEVAGLRDALEQRAVDVHNLNAAVADTLRQLDAFRQSLSWRWTAPARAIYRLLTGQ